MTATRQVAGRTVEDELVRFQPAWIRYAPATLAGAVTALFLVGLGWRVTGEAHLHPDRISAVRSLLDHMGRTALWIDVVQIGLAVAVLVAVLSVAGYLIAFWGFRLTRHSGGSLHVARGAVRAPAAAPHRRSTLPRDRDRPPGRSRVRARRHSAGTAGPAGSGDRGRVRGTRDTETGRGRVRAPRCGRAPTALCPGARAHRRRRGGSRGVDAGRTASGLGRRGGAGTAPGRRRGRGRPVPQPRARGGAEPDGRRWLVTRYGSLVRRRCVLDTDGVIGVTMRQSLFQRRLGLTSLTVTTAAGRQQYPVTDLADDTASALAQQLVTNWSEKRLRDPARCCVCAQSSAAPSPGQRGTR